MTLRGSYAPEFLVLVVVSYMANFSIPIFTRLS
jgi:hypothetical protein